MKNVSVLTLITLAILTSVSLGDATIISFSTTGSEVSGIRDTEILGDGSYQKFAYLAASTSVDVPEDGMVHYYFIMPWQIDLVDLGISGKSPWFRADRTLTIEGYNLLTSGPNGGPQHQILVDFTGSAGICASAGMGRHTINLDESSALDVLIPCAGQLTVGLNPDPNLPELRTATAEYPICFRIRQRVAGPQLTYPLQDCQDTDFMRDVLLMWSDMPQAAAYQIEVASDPNFQQVLFSTIDVPRTYCTVSCNYLISKSPSFGIGNSSLRFHSVKSPFYYWRVRASKVWVNGSEATGYGDWSETRRFMSTSASFSESRPTLKTPVDGQTDVYYLHPISMSWTPVHGALSYLFQVGTGGVNDWGFGEILCNVNTIADCTYATFYNSLLAPDQEYGWRVRVSEYDPEVYTGDCSWSEVSSFTTRSQVTDLTMGQALLTPDETYIEISGEVTTYGHGDYFYVQESDRSCGIKVMYPHGITRGRKVYISGALRTEGPEKYVDADYVKMGVQSPPPKPLAMTQRQVGGQSSGNPVPLGFDDVWGKSSLYNLGLLAQITGKITGVGPDFVYIDDGSGINDGNTVGPEGSCARGIRVVRPADAQFPAEGYLLVTGVLGSAQVDGQWIRVIRPRSVADIVLIQ